MLVPMTAPMGMAPDMKEVGMVEQCPKYYSEEYLDTFGITPHEYEQFRQHGMHEYRKRSVSLHLFSRKLLDSQK